MDLDEILMDLVLKTLVLVHIKYLLMLSFRYHGVSEIPPPEISRH
jgi:hypothetical protein